MKKIISCVCMLLLLASCQHVMAQPSPVITTKYSDAEIMQMMQTYRTHHSVDTQASITLNSKFQADFPNAKDIEWETSNSIYEVDFEIGYTDYEAYYDGEGNLFYYSYEIPESSLPAVVKNAVIAKYPDYVFEDINKIYRGSEVLFDVDIKRGNIEMELLIKDDGTVMKERRD